jgi:hypothetical protein
MPKCCNAGKAVKIKEEEEEKEEQTEKQQSGRWRNLRERCEPGRMEKMENRWKKNLKSSEITKNRNDFNSLIWKCEVSRKKERGKPLGQESWKEVNWNGMEVRSECPNTGRRGSEMSNGGDKASSDS